MTIVTFIDFKYHNYRCHPGVTLYLNKNSMFFETHDEAVRWLEDHGFVPLSDSKETDSWELILSQQSIDDDIASTHTDKRAIVTNAVPQYSDEDWTPFCREGYCEMGY